MRNAENCTRSAASTAWRGVTPLVQSREACRVPAHPAASVAALNCECPAHGNAVTLLLDKPLPPSHFTSFTVSPQLKKKSRGYSFVNLIGCIMPRLVVKDVKETGRREERSPAPLVSRSSKARSLKHEDKERAGLLFFNPMVDEGNEERKKEKKKARVWPLPPPVHQLAAPRPGSS